MRFSLLPTLLLSAASACCVVPLLAWAQPTPVAAGTPQNEPAVKRGVVEDDNARIEELRVRGAVRSTTVKPKGPIRAEYEVLPVDAGRDVSDGPTTAKGAAGQRVWRVLSF